MLCQQHKLVGNKIWVGANVTIPGRPAAVGRIVFTRMERIRLTDPDLFEELRQYDQSVAKMSVKDFRELVEKGRLTLEVRRSFGSVNGWAGDHAKLNPPNGQLRRFSDLHVELQHVKGSVNAEFFWQRLAKERGHTHALGIWPAPGAADTPKPLYKIHANWSPKKKRFADPALVKRTDDGSWRVSWLVDVDGFTPGERLAWWIPVTPDVKMTLP